jgi:hypothetical protein
MAMPLLVIPNPGTALKNNLKRGLLNRSVREVALKHNRLVIIDNVNSSPDVILYLSHT